MSPGPTLLAQLSDPHVQVGRGDRESAKALGRAVRSVIELPTAPQAVIVTGDLVDTPGVREYERVRELLAPLPMPVYVIAGNHDDREALRELFGRDRDTGSVGEPFRYTARVGGLRLIACDTTVPGLPQGSFELERRLWLETELLAEPAMPTVVAMHHPPLQTGILGLDRICLSEPERIALGDLLAMQPHARRVISGHVHRGAFDVLGGCGVVACPSTYLQAPLEIPGDGDTDVDLVPEPAGFAIHALLDGDELTSHIQPVVG